MSWSGWCERGRSTRQLNPPGGQAGYVLRRLGLAVVQVALLMVLIFVLVVLMPGDAVGVQATDLYSQAQMEESRQALGLDRPGPERFVAWALAAVQGDFGTSLSTGAPVTQVIAGPFRVTAFLALCTTALLVPIAVGAGFVAGLRPGTLADRVISGAAITLDSVPDFVLALLLVAWLSLSWGLLPATFLGLDLAGMIADPRYLVLPLSVMLARVSAPLVRLVRAGVITVMATPYIRQAQRLGVPRVALLGRHVAPNALGPAMQELGRTSDGLLSGVLIVEAIFVVPGVASTLIGAINTRDEPVILAIILITGTAAILINVGIDLLGRAMQPRSVTW